ncbi:MAG TPA: sigma-70 region 4 domain-containing protein [Solirubrobacteraceae bacterium]|nr:sigma-70 region 4 domain-containing protein [Solirubrobacteraceae bacterium]
MSELDALPADQRAAVQLLLRQGQSYDQLADLLGIDPAGVRARAHAALDALGPAPGGGLDAGARADVADYLLGQQSVSEREITRDLLAESGDAREWAAGVADALRPLAGDALPDVPGTAGAPPEPEPETEAEVYEPETAEEWPAREIPPEEPPARDEPTAPEEPPVREEPPTREEPPARERVEEEPAGFEEEPAGFEEDEDEDEPAAFDFPPREGRRPARERPGRPERPGRRDRADRTPSSAATRAPSSRLGGALLLAGVGIVLAVVIVLLINGGGDDDDNGSTVSRTAPTQTQTNPQTPTAQINLVSASGNSRQVGLAQIFEQGNRRSLIVAGQGLRPGAYALWLYSSRSDAKLLGFVPQRVGKDGRFATQGELPTDAERYDELVVTRERVTDETTNPPEQPGRIVLRGDLKLD